MIHARKNIKDFLTANGASTKEAICADCGAKGTNSRRVERIISRMIARGRIIQNGDTYELTPVE